MKFKIELKNKTENQSVLDLNENMLVIGMESIANAILRQAMENPKLKDKSITIIITRTE